MKKSQNGFSVTWIVAVCAVVGVIGFVGWYVIRANKETDTVSQAKSIGIEKDTSSLDTYRDREEEVISKSVVQPAAAFKEQDYDFELSDYPSGWVALACTTSLPQDGAIARKLTLQPEQTDSLNCANGMLAMETRVNLEVVSGSSWSKSVVEYQKNRGQYQAFKERTVTEENLAGKQMLKVREVWGKDAVLPEGSVTVGYYYYDAGSDKLFTASYVQKPGDQDLLADFESIVKTKLSIHF